MVPYGEGMNVGRNPRRDTIAVVCRTPAVGKWCVVGHSLTILQEPPPRVRSSWPFSENEKERTDENGSPYH